jgi:hypothetical protein
MRLILPIHFPIASFANLAAGTLAQQLKAEISFEERVHPICRELTSDQIR